jgi:hypothetical protein
MWEKHEEGEKKLISKANQTNGWESAFPIPFPQPSQMPPYKTSIHLPFCH